MEILLQLNESRGFVIEVLSGEYVLCSENVCDFLEVSAQYREACITDIPICASALKQCVAWHFATVLWLPDVLLENLKAV